MDPMSHSEQIPEHWQDLIEKYLDGSLDESGMQELEGYLCSDEAARQCFVRYARLHTDLQLEMRARQAANRALQHIETLSETEKPAASSTTSSSTRIDPRPPSYFSRKRLALVCLGAAAALAIVLAVRWRVKGRSLPSAPEGDAAIAWLVNAQDCTWSGPGPEGNLQAGRVLQIERGLAEIHFQCHARVVLEGPSILELISSKSARLTSGKLTARVPEAAIGFEILSPQGRVIDLGTEFGVHAANGTTDVYVFQGQVEALPASSSPEPEQKVSLLEHQAARMASGRVTIRPVPPAAAEGQFVRAIVPPPVIVPRTLHLAFRRPVESTLLDRTGLGTGLTHRLPGTGAKLAGHDPNLRLNRDKEQLELTTTNSDLNTQYKLFHGEYLGVRLRDLGFKGWEDFAATVTIPNIPALEVVGQFGLFAGARSDCSIRGGLIGDLSQPGQYTQFLVNNQKGCDTPDVCKVGLLSPGTDLRLTLKRIQGKYALTVENLTTGNASTLTIRHPDFLDSESDLYVGLFGANTQSEVRKTLVFKDFQTTVWTVAASSPR
jgi:ferric-dicitrate binding protein FerR (iron transport regulator)